MLRRNVADVNCSSTSVNAPPGQLHPPLRNSASQRALVGGEINGFLGTEYTVV
ncbi:unnamed protein product [Strongylus vulgaris]|uniref:Uncharacterized protein n=1 Tax=Strongylus vulgaris TaxID=40348 RepID=A0A3P7IX16_STRVU|nr:unnamed protein product [Strongylus vulgaris]